EDLCTKQQELRDLFHGADYQWLEIQPDPEDTAPIFRWVAKVTSIEFPEDLWAQYCDYIVTLELQTDPWDHISGYDETWELTQNDKPRDTFQLVHKITCSSLEEYIVATASVKEGWKKAYDYLRGTLSPSAFNTIDGNIVFTGAEVNPGFALAVTFDDYDYTINKLCDEHNGRFEITETWLMSENNYDEEQTVTVNFDRDALEGENYSTTVEGTITGHKTNPEGNGWTNAQSRWTTVEAALYATAGSFTPVTLSTSVRTRRVTYDELNRVISYSYVYDEGIDNCEEDITITVATDENDCDKVWVTVDGTITGKKSDTATAYENALVCFNTIKVDDSYSGIRTLAVSAYNDAGYTTPVLRDNPSRRSISTNEYRGTVGFNFTYHNGTGDFEHDTTVTANYSRETDNTTVSVEGNIEGDCAGTWETVEVELLNVTNAWAIGKAREIYAGYTEGDTDVPEFMVHTTPGTELCEFPVAKSITRNEVDRIARYSFEFSDDDACRCDVDYSVTVRDHPESCGDKLVTVEGNLKGRRTGPTTANNPWGNCQTEFNSNFTDAQILALAETAYYGAGDVYRISKSTTFSEPTFTINFSHEFTNEAAWSIEETITERQDEDNCGYVNVSVNGTVTGVCDDTGAYANALNGFNTDVTPNLPPTLGWDGLDITPVDGQTLYEISSSVGRNEKRGTISYNFEYASRDTTCITDLTETLRHNEVECYDTVVVDGVVTGFCTDNNNRISKYNGALACFDNMKNADGLIAPSADYPGNWTIVSSSVGRNKYAGRISFSYEWRQSNVCVEGAITNSLDIRDELVADVFAVVEVLGGDPVLQDKSATTRLRREVHIEVTMKPDCNVCTWDFNNPPTSNEPDVDTLIDSYDPIGMPNIDISLVDTNRKTWNPWTGNFSRTKAWVYGPCEDS
ncbi:MAG: hypothetical protein ACW99Q_20565, partial [Candidatus Kariarchaeaceae archaeon]